MTSLPSIVVVDSSKEPEEQRRTQITIYKPSNSAKSAHGARAVSSSFGAKRSSNSNRTSRVQRRIDASKSKLSSVAAISKGHQAPSGGDHAIVVPNAKPAMAPTPPVTNSSSTTTTTSSSSGGTRTNRPLNKTDSKTRSGSVKSGRKQPLQKRTSKQNVLKKQAEQRSSQSPPMAKVEDEPYVVEADEGVAETDLKLEEQSAPEIAVNDPSSDDTDDRAEEEKEIERIKAQIKRNLKPKNTPEDKAKAKTVVKQLETRIARRRPTKLESKWLLWKYMDEEEHPLDFIQHNENPSDVGWGRRIYDKDEIESDDREREKMALTDESMRNLNMKIKDVPEKYGLWDNVYDKRVIRTLDCNLHWKPNRREDERRKKLRQKRQKEKMKRRRSRQEGVALNDEDYKPFEDSKDKWFATGERLTEDDMSFILTHTNFQESAVIKWFGNFRAEVPSGKLTKMHLTLLFRQIFPGGDSETFCNHIFRIFDSDNNGFLDFKEFLMALDVASCRDEREKLEWAFRLYDVDASGSINLKEITTIMETLNQVEGGSGGNVDDKAKEIFEKLDTDNDGEISMEEFVDGYLKLMQQDNLFTLK